jgi:NAD(P)-dependent dehydrogenase (short-subunit alcohol dehydrogenase family)
MAQTRSMFETNFFGPPRLIQLLTPHMRAQQNGTIINISSGSTWRGMPSITLYATSKAAINGLSSLSSSPLTYVISTLLQI